MKQDLSKSVVDDGGAGGGGAGPQRGSFSTEELRALFKVGARVRGACVRAYARACRSACGARAHLGCTCTPACACAHSTPHPHHPHPHPHTPSTHPRQVDPEALCDTHQAIKCGCACNKAAMEAKATQLAAKAAAAEAASQVRLFQSCCMPRGGVQWW